ncbi:hypothetical protein B0H10DRAFT_2073512 [Mycena sp. CBHHK59/15]|nr:hypothetical protein B0H10DRAFT_2073512 [Mycena sp. CBHHK59/15]
MPSTSFNSKTYSRKPSKRKSESAKESTPDAKRRKVDLDRVREVSTDVEEELAPRKTPRDLSQIFEAVTPSSPSSTSPGKLVKRMLSRSRTESSIASGSKSPSKSSFSRTPSLPNAVQPTDQPPSPEAPQTPHPRPNITVGRTYAGNSRSFLVPIPVNPGSLEQLQEELDDEFAARESYTSLRTRWGVDDSEDDPYAYGSPTRSGSNLSTPNASPSKKGKGKARPEPVPLPNGMMNPLKSITELRNQGESRRFLDEVGYLWEGLGKTNGLGLRRASALEITTKLQSIRLPGPTWDLLNEAGGGQDEDKILDVLLAFFSALVSRDLGSLTDLTQRSSSSFMSILFHSSPVFRHTAQLRKLGLSKKDQNLLNTIYTAISSSSLFPESTPLSTSLLRPAHLVYPHTQYLSLLDIYILGRWAPHHHADDLEANRREIEDSRDSWLADIVCSRRSLGSVSATSQQDTEAQVCVLVTLRLLVSLSHSDQKWCAKLKKSELCLGFILRFIIRGHSAIVGKVEKGPGANGNGNGNGKVKQEDSPASTNGNARLHAKRNGGFSKDNKAKKEDSDDEVPGVDDTLYDEEGGDQTLDNLYLTLGDEEIKDVLRDAHISLQCTLSKPSCLSASSVAANVKPEPSPEPRDAETAVATRELRILVSHLSLLFGLLMINNPDNQAVLLAALPVPTSPSQYDGDAAKVDILVGQAREFANMYSGTDGGDAAEEGEIVKTVIRFLEFLRIDL